MNLNKIQLTPQIKTQLYLLHELKSPQVLLTLLHVACVLRLINQLNTWKESINSPYRLM